MSKLVVAIRGAQINLGVAGDGLIWATDDAMAVNVDGSSIEIVTDALQVKALGITDAMLAGSIVYDKLILTGAILNTDLAGSIALGKLASGVSADIVVADATGIPTYVAMTGDLTISNVGVASIGALKVVDAMINDDVAVGLAGAGLTATAGVLSATGVANAVVNSDVIEEDQSANANGVTTVFPLANTPVASSLGVYLTGLLQVRGSGKSYTLSTNQVSFAIPPKTGDLLIFRYIKI